MIDRSYNHLSNFEKNLCVINLKPLKHDVYYIQINRYV